MIGLALQPRIAVHSLRIQLRKLGGASRGTQIDEHLDFATLQPIFDPRVDLGFQAEPGAGEADVNIEKTVVEGTDLAAASAVSSYDFGAAKLVSITALRKVDALK